MLHKTKWHRVSGLILLTVSVFAVYARVPAYNPLQQMRPFDEYGRILWDDEKARLDNFAIQLLNEPQSVGYIFVYDGPEMCDREAESRAIRAKRYIVEHRGVPWNRVIWRKEGYRSEFRISLQPVTRRLNFPDSFVGPDRSAAEVHATRQCKARITQIKKSKW